jgi:hypothetical protein
MKIDKLTELSINELCSINGGGIVKDVWSGIGYFIGGIFRGAAIREQSGSHGVVGAHT